MADYRRWYVDGGTYFFTLTTYRRRPLFRDALARSLLGTAMREVNHDAPFKTVAIVLLWEHLHAIWSLPSGDRAYPERWQTIKAKFTKQYLDQGGTELQVTRSQAKNRRRGVWQRRYYEHVVRDEAELEAYCDYIHYNPVKHGYTKRPADWPWSSFHRFVTLGQYDVDWGRAEPENIRNLDLD